ncbi:putative acetyltransferase At3g50280 [Silene latifolia]|uniref:putative acetyltransferase At3g50280 n=1 Tax=Silene latifolia TaxID=37657 RepID=UPI003D7769EF
MTCFTDEVPNDVTIISKSTVIPSQTSTIGDLKLSVSDLPMLSCHYIQKGGLFTRPPFATEEVISLLKEGLSVTLTHFPALAGRLKTDADGYVYITCNDAGVDFVHAAGKCVYIRDVLGEQDVPDVVKQFFTYDRTVSYKGHFQPILAVQVTELADGLFIGCSVNHSVTDGTSFWNFFNTFAEVCRGVRRITKPPEFSRNSVLVSPAVLKVPEGGPVVTFNEFEPLRERIFKFSRESILELKSKVNYKKFGDSIISNDRISAVELLGKQSNDPWKEKDTKTVSKLENWIRNAVAVSKPRVVNETDSTEVEVSSFQSLCALLWRCVTRARKMDSNKTTTFRMAVNCRHRLEPKLDPLYFGNAIQSIPTFATVGDVLSKDLRWAAEQLNTNVKAHGDKTVRKFIGDWESNPRTFPLGNFDGGMITMGSSPRFPMYDNDFGWGRPVAVRSGRANKFDGKISAFPGREGGGSVDLEVVLSPETMAGLESDPEFMQYVSLGF